MYVETIFCENMGPIEKAVIRAGGHEDGFYARRETRVNVQC